MILVETCMLPDYIGQDELIIDGDRPRLAQWVEMTRSLMNG